VTTAVPAAAGPGAEVADGELLRILRGALAGGAPLTRVERAPGPRASSYRIEVVTLHRAGAPDLRLFLKDLGVCRHRKDGMAARRWRELRVYRDLLAGAGLGTPALHGAVWDEARGRFWLLLEHVEARPLDDLRFVRWLDAARWLGVMQARFAGRDLSAAGYLARHDADFAASTAEAARRAVAAFPARLGARLDAALRGHERWGAAAAAGAATLVHGVYRPYNVLARPEAAGWRVCPTDWEEASLGPALYDLACLSDGFDLGRLHLLVNAYEHPLARAGLPIGDRAATLRALAALQAHRNLRTLGKAHARSFSAEGVERLVGRVETLAGRAR
jgi:Phosphotransferase enzyme family